VKPLNLVGIFSGLLALVGFIVGMNPVGTGCGSPFSPQTSSIFMSATECTEALQSSRMLAIAMVAVGGAGLLTALYGVAVEGRKEKLRDEETARRASESPAGPA
jgi:hypothetical protein